MRCKCFSCNAYIQCNEFPLCTQHFCLKNTNLAQIMTFVIFVNPPKFSSTYIRNTTNLMRNEGRILCVARINRENETALLDDVAKMNALESSTLSRPSVNETEPLQDLLAVNVMQKRSDWRVRARVDVLYLEKTCNSANVLR